MSLRTQGWATISSFEAKRDSLLRGFGLYGDRIRNEQGDHKFALIADDHRIRDVRASLQRVLDGLGRNKFSRGGFE